MDFISFNASIISKKGNTRNFYNPFLINLIKFQNWETISMIGFPFSDMKKLKFQSYPKGVKALCFLHFAFNNGKNNNQNSQEQLLNSKLKFILVKCSPYIPA